MRYTYFSDNKKPIPNHLRNLFESLDKLSICSQNDVNTASNIILDKLRATLEQNGYIVEEPNKRLKVRVSADKLFCLDAISVDGSVVVEIEGCRTIENYQILKDVFECTLMKERFLPNKMRISVQYLVIIVPENYMVMNNKTNKVTHKNPYERSINLLEPVYSKESYPFPLKGILLIGY